MNIIEAIKERKSVRNYDGNPLKEAQIEELNNFIFDLTSPFKGNVDIRLRKFDLKGDYKPSTYGIIKGAVNYFLMAMGEDSHSLLNAGFKFEQVVLKATEMGLGTCWIGGTFKGSSFDKDEQWPDGTTLKIICPVGIAGKRGLVDKAAKVLLGSRKRKPFEELFFTHNFKSSLPRDNKFGESLEMLRLAPSGTNSQPWRVLVEDDTVRFYYVSKGEFPIIDSGIGICHFYETEKYNGYVGYFFKESNYPDAPENWKYLTTYKRN